MQPSKKSEGNLDRLLKARAEIDEELRRHKSTLTVLFTDIVGSTHYFERFGDTAGLAMLHRHTEQATAVIQQHQGNVIKTIGDSVMAEFPEPALAVRAAVDIQRQQWKQNEQLPDQEQTHLRIGVHAGLGFRYGGDVYGDVVNVAARVTKRTGPAQILISGAVRETLSGDAQLRCHSLGKITIEGRAEKEEVFEALWTDAETYAGLRRRLSSALQRGDLVSPGVQLDDLMPVEPGAPAEDPARASLKPLAARYQVMGEVSRGGMGIVYKARDRETGELLALKVLKPEIAADQAVMERFINELRLARKITIEGRAEKEEVFEALWTDAETYAGLRRRLSSALQRGDLVSPGVQLDDLMPVEPGAPAEDPARASLKPLAARYQVMGEVSRGGMGIVYKA